MLILAFSDYLPQAQRLAARLGLPLAEVEIHRFPDGESFVALPPDVPEHVLFCRSLNRPNDKLIELLLGARTARELGAKRLTLIAPYLCYMRQDFANRPGVAVSQRHVGRWLADLFDDVITVDPHLHRIDRLNQAIPLDHAISLNATAPLAAFLKQKFGTALLLGPDSESRQWAAALAELTGFAFQVAEKIRLGDTEVILQLPDADYRKQPVVIVDDMASTGRTLAKAAELLKEKGAAEIYAVVTHALFCGDAEHVICDAGVKTLWSTDSINHPTSCITLDGLLADAVVAMLN
ncbi:ribose-phosphate diphosphokinase [Candidatus Methylomicrobium oryzae]|jgi:ribose-phosphate pyrophosphokinase|uniref:ribose-phosphate diphosphokinase n=1 Tax=Candidatus Methylomicrobium oryzae TaxID=2802053 RepID=UPI001921280F|nr:ribose-phosphate diphosphokinase [Methylomicrobium sp. RS1]MBL1264081.1 ribose-phosphate diphosphokinase [Methylomicrobium sp. RS1]